jgi:hypothetical protein
MNPPDLGETVEQSPYISCGVYSLQRETRISISESMQELEHSMRGLTTCDWGHGIRKQDRTTDSKSNSVENMKYSDTMSPTTCCNNHLTFNLHLLLSSIYIHSVCLTLTVCYHGSIASVSYLAYSMAHRSPNCSLVYQLPSLWRTWRSGPTVCSLICSNPTV